MVATPGTIPALPQYQPGALPISGQEAVEIVNSTNATAASSWSMLITDIVGKAPSAMALANPTSNDLIAFFRSNGTSGGSYYAASVGNLVNIPAGNLPTGGGTSQILAKNSGNNYDASWTNIASLMTAIVTGGIAITGSTVAAFAIASGGVGSTQLAANAVGNNQFRQGTGLSVVGVTGNATANVADISGTAGQVLRVNDAGTAVAFGPVDLTQGAAVTGVLPGANFSAVNLAASGAGGVQGALPIANGGTNTTTLTANGLLYGAGTTTVKITAAANSAVLVTNASGTPSLSQTLPTAVQAAITQLGTVTTGMWNAGVIGVSYGGTNTSTLTANGVLVGNGTSTVGITAAAATGQMVMGQGTASPPIMQYPGHTLVNTLTASNSSSIQDTTSFTSTFNDYLLIFDNLVPSANATMEMLYQTGGSFVGASYINSSGGATTYGDILVGSQAYSGAGGGISGWAYVFGVNGAANYKQTRGLFSALTNATTLTNGGPAFIYNGASTVLTGFQIKPAAGTLTSGTVRVYGMRAT